jgi:hypothetical protein
VRRRWIAEVPWGMPWARQGVCVEREGAKALNTMLAVDCAHASGGPVGAVGAVGRRRLSAQAALNRVRRCEMRCDAAAQPNRGVFHGCRGIPKKFMKKIEKMTISVLSVNEAVNVVMLVTTVLVVADDGSEDSEWRRGRESNSLRWQAKEVTVGMATV